MSTLRLLFAGLLYHRRMNVAVALGVVVATAVLTGSLVVGDSMRGSLRWLVLDRLGRIDEVLVTDRFFRAALADELAGDDSVKQDYEQVVPTILLTAAAKHADSERRASGVTLLGSNKAVWELGHTPDDVEPPSGDEVVLGRSLAEALHAAVGDDVLLRVARPNQVPADSPLGRKTDTVESLRLTVSAVVPDEGLGRFSLRSDQRAPQNAFVSLARLQSFLEQVDRVNALIAAGRFAAIPPGEEASQRLAAALRPSLADLGLTVSHVASEHQGARVLDYFQLTSDRMMLPEAAEEAAASASSSFEVQPALTYLANFIEAAGGRAKISYSTVTAVDPSPGLGPYARDADGKPIGTLADDEIVLNQWAADDLRRQGADLRPHDPILLTFFEPESTHGQVRERTATFRLKGVIPLAAPEGRPTRAADPDLTPTVDGVTDKESIANWNPPFPYDSSRVRSAPPNDQDDLYWKAHRATPKAFVSLAAGRRLWKSRFGQATSVRVAPSPGPDGSPLTAEAWAARIESQLDPATMGFVFRPVKRQGLAAADGTTSFSDLFLGFSMFLIAAAVMLVALLFRLGTEQRAAELGLLEAVGIRRRAIGRLYCGEGAIVAAIGATGGAAGGIGFAALLIAALNDPHWWGEAIRAPFLRLVVPWSSVVIGWASGLIVCVTVIGWTLWRSRRVSVRRLLAGELAGESQRVRRRGRLPTVAAGLCIAGSIAVGIWAIRSGGDAQAGAFFGCGALVLVAALFWAWSGLASGARGSVVEAGGQALLRLAIRNAGRNPGRSTLSIGLVAAASFLIVAVSAFRQSPTEAGSGGLALLAESDRPIYYDFGSSDGRRALDFTDEASQAIRTASVYPVRVHGGDDASCLNLYRPRQPRVLGVTDSFIERGGFAWSQAATDSPEQQTNPWRLLLDDASSEIPVVLDANTAHYSLHLPHGVGDTIVVRDGADQPVVLRVVGLLSGSVFQGDLIMAESRFLNTFAEESGYRMFLIDAPQEHAEGVATMLEQRFDRDGMSVVAAQQRLRDFLAVQNTYLSTFQSLGALGLLLGTFGLATVQMRNVFERRGELALLRAIGFRRGALAMIVLLENSMLLVGGLAAGVLAAAVAVLPHLLGGEAGIPLAALAAMLGTILAVGLLAAAATARSTLRAPLIPALRGQ